MMKEKLIKNDLLKEEYYEIDHESGLKIFVMEKPDYNGAYALFGTKYGSVDTCFKIKGAESYTTVPEGIAHFLEHKLFESEELDAFERFAETGANANAYTSFDRTCYLFQCSGEFEKNLEILLDFVKAPYFTEETVQKEQGIIGQEIRMYQDSPDWQVLFNLLRGLYSKNPVRIDIAGTIESIAEINANLLYSCYNTFYNLSNMALAVAGNTTVEQVLEVADRLLEADEDVTVERTFLDEPSHIVKDYVEENLPVVTPVFAFGYKESHATPERTLQEEVAMSVILDIVAGQMSPLYKELLDDGLVNNTFSTEYFHGYNYAAPLFSGESVNPREVAERIKKAIKDLQNKLITEEQFETVRKKQYGKTVRAFSDVDTVANALVISHFADEELFSEFEVIKSLELSFVNDLLVKSFNEEAAALSVVCGR